MSFLSLPPELLREIIESAAGPLPSRNAHQYKSRQKTLCSLSLVNSFLRLIAQSSLIKEIWHRGSDGFFDLSSLYAQFGEDPLKRLAVQHFGSICHSASWEDMLGLLRDWRNLQSLRIVGSSTHPVFFSFDGLEYFPHLHEVYLEDSVVAPSTFSIQLPNLRRLVFVGTGLAAVDVVEYLNTFTPTVMPHLIHLTIDSGSDQCSRHFGSSFSQLFHLIFPQIRTLAVHKIQPSDFLAFVVSSMPKLEHLSIEGHEESLSQALFTSGVGLKLKTLRLDASIMSHRRSKFQQRLSNVAKGEEENIAVERLIFYGWRHGSEYVEDGIDVNVFEWVSRGIAEYLLGIRARFLHLDGSCEEDLE